MGEQELHENAGASLAAGACRLPVGEPKLGMPTGCQPALRCKFMFDLERAIGEWRKRTQAAGLRAPDLLDELESHLREEIECLLDQGMDERRAFELAARNMGEVTELKREFMKTANSTWTSFLAGLKRFVLGVREVPLPALEAFEPAARQTLEFAPEEARRFNHTFVGTEHLLLGLMRSGSNGVSRVMHGLGVNVDTVRLEIEKFVGKGSAATGAGTIPFTPRARQALHLALDEARQLNQRNLKPEHIFLGLLREGGGVAAVVLKNLHVSLDDARAEVLKEMKA